MTIERQTCGLFGKLASKRDFIAVHTSRGFLDVWEPWMESSLSASLEKLGTLWQSVYLNAPIWRFWLGRDLCGVETVGAIMPSLDGAGRYFPLTLIAQAKSAQTVPSPLVDAQDAWFEKVEAFLLETIDTNVPYERTLAELAELPFSSVQDNKMPDAALKRIGPLLAATAPDCAQALLALKQNTRSHSAFSYWWSIGGEGIKPAAFETSGLPAPHLFTDMLAGSPVQDETQRQSL